MRHSWGYLYAVLVGATLCAAGSRRASAIDIHQVDLKELYNSKATSLGGENDGVGMQDGSTFPSAHLPTGDHRDLGVKFRLPSSWDNLEKDNVRADFQMLHLTKPAPVRTLHLLASGEDPGGFLKGESVEQLGLTFSDGYVADVSFELKNWYGIHWTNKAAIRTPHRFLQDGQIDYNASHIFHIDIPLPPHTSSHLLSSIQLPGPAVRNCLHIFAMSYTSFEESDDALSGSQNLEVLRAEAIRDWEIVDGTKGQIVEVTLFNPNPAHKHDDRSTWVTDTVSIELIGDGFTTVRPGEVHRLMPGDQVTVRIIIQPTKEPNLSALDRSSVRYAGDQSRDAPVTIEGSLVYDWTLYTEDVADLEQHRSPAWFNGAKFGIFIHWGLYAVPAWADEGRYAEWYGYWLHGHEGGSADYHKEVYGEDFTYDDFIPQFTGAKFNASAWVDLFAEAGAKYFVLTTKHHDGFALFDTKETSQRSSVRMGPKRDFLRELMDAAERERPELGKGTYYSMPEWWNPSYEKYSKELFGGGLARNPYNDSESLPYTGYTEVEDYIEDIQLEQMRILAKDYKTDLMWCDIGLVNHSSAFASEWFAESAREGRHVSMNNRCGIGGDFDTPEMTQFANAQTQKWETCSSMDPHSFGFNKMTKAEDYRNATNIIHYIIDITAKGGNLLLNVGPNAEGEIIDAMAKPLLEAGQWLKSHGEAIYDTEPFMILPELRNDEVDVRFTRTGTAFYIISLKPPTMPSFTVEAPLPLWPGDVVSLLGSSRPVEWTSENCSTTFNLEEGEVAGAGSGIAWVIKIDYTGSARKSDKVSVHDEL